MKFKEIGLHESILKALEKNKYEELTPVQEAVIPAVLDGLDVLGCSQTGSGKTGAFLIPILSKLVESADKKAIIIVPTRELATQTMDNVKMFSENDKGINKALLIGGASIRDQLLLIQKKPRLIVGTPGRINDFLSSKRLKLDDFSILVLDEMDRMLDMGFSIQIDDIIKSMPSQRQNMLFSATISKKIEKITPKYLRKPLVVKIGEQNKASTNVSQEIINVEDSEKFNILLEKLKEDTIFTLVFVRTKFGTEKLAIKLEKENIMARAIHGDLKQSKRARIIKDFREKKFNVLVATDVAARGLDIHHIDTVINYDLPESPEDYIHRIGRCSRGLEAIGTSISFCGKNDGAKLKAIKSLMSTGDYEENKEFKKEKGKNRGGNRSKDNNRFSSRHRVEKPKDTEKTDFNNEEILKNSEGSAKNNSHDENRTKNFRVNRKSNFHSKNKSEKFNRNEDGDSHKSYRPKRSNRSGERKFNSKYKSERSSKNRENNFHDKSKS